MNKRIKVKLDRFTVDQIQRCGRKSVIKGWAEGNLILGNNSDYRINQKSE